MYSDIFSKLYDAFGWNYYPESFAQLLLRWIDEQGLHINNMLDLGCGTGILCNMIAEHGIETMGMDLSHGMIAMSRQQQKPRRQQRPRQRQQPDRLRRTIILLRSRILEAQRRVLRNRSPLPVQETVPTVKKRKRQLSLHS